MKLFLAVVFFCVNGECVFWKSNTNFYDMDQCLQEVAKTIDSLAAQGLESAGTCLTVNMNEHI